MWIFCISWVLFALCNSTKGQMFLLSGEADPLGAPIRGPLGPSGTAFELDSFVETDEGELASLNPELSEEDQWDWRDTPGETGTQQRPSGPLASANRSPSQPHANPHGAGEAQPAVLKGRNLSPFPSALQPDGVYVHRSIRGVSSVSSALQLGEKKALLSGIGGALLGSVGGTLMGGVKQTLSGPFALNTADTNLTAGVTAPGAIAGAPAAAVAAPAAATGAPGSPTPMMASSATVSADTSHNVTGIVIGVIVGLFVLCLVGGCVWKMTKKKKGKR